MKKLSKAQIRLLQLMQERNAPVIIMYSGVETSIFIGGEGRTIKGFYYRTVRLLEDGGFLKSITKEEYRWRSTRYALTEKAIEFLKEDRNDVA